MRRTSMSRSSAPVDVSGGRARRPRHHPRPRRVVGAGGARKEPARGTAEGCGARRGHPRALYDTLLYCPTSCPYRPVCGTDAACSSNTIRDSISRVAPSLRGPRSAPTLRHARRPRASYVLLRARLKRGRPNLSPSRDFAPRNTAHTWTDGPPPATFTVAQRTLYAVRT